MNQPGGSASAPGQSWAARCEYDVDDSVRSDAEDAIGGRSSIKKVPVNSFGHLCCG